MHKFDNTGNITMIKDQNGSGSISSAEKQPLLVIVGPTAVGKTAAAIEVAKRLQGEIISGDSAQIYKYMDIGTAKPSLSEQQGIPHYLLDLLMPDDEYSVALFQKWARRLITEIDNRDRLPMIVGGTGLYVNAVIYDYHLSDQPNDPEYRAELQKQAELKGKVYLHEQLKKIDPLAADRIHPNDLRRIIRALEVYHISGITITEQERSGVQPASSEAQDNQPRRSLYDLFMAGLSMDRRLLYKRIEQRVDIMMEQGLVEEVNELIKRGYSRSLVSMQALGYKEIAAYLAGECSLDDAVTMIKRDTRRFAKRQFTWFNRDKNIRWYDVTQYDSQQDLAEKICDDYRCLC